MIDKLSTLISTHVFSTQPLNEKGLKRVSAILGFSFFIVFFIIAWLFYQERMIPFDGAFYCFKMVDGKFFNLELGRIGAAMTQLLPVLSLQWNASLETILRLYSINFIAVQFVIFLILQYGLKDYRAVLALLLALCLGYRYQFYYTVSEIHQTIAPVVLVFALLNSSLLEDVRIKRKIIFFCSFVLLCAWLANIHMLSLVLVSFVVALAVIRKVKLLKEKWFWFSVAGGYPFFIYKILIIEKGSYDASKMITGEKIKMTLTHLTEIPAFQFFGEEFFRSYYILVLAALCLLACYVYRKKWMLLLYVTATLIGFFILMIAYNIVPDSPVVYQNYYACFGLFIAIALSLEIVEDFRPKIVFAFVGLLLLLSTIKIIQCGRMYELRMAYFSRMENNVKGLPESKFMIYNRNINWNMIWTDWDMGFETLIHSALASPDAAVTFATVNNYSDYDSMMYKSNTFIGVAFSPYWFTSEHMSQDYFRIKNTPYRILNKIPADSQANAGFNSTNLQLHFQQEEIDIPYFGYHILPIRVTNQSDDTLYSNAKGKSKVAIGYRLYDEAGALLSTVNDASLLEMDVYPHTQKIVGVELKHLRRGTYILVTDLVREEEEWLRVGGKCKVVIY